MDIKLYQQYLNEFVRNAVRQSNGSVQGTAERLHELEIKGIFVSHREEKRRALADAQRAFDDHRHWPMEIIISHLGISMD